MQQMRAEAARSRNAAALQYGVLHEAPQEDALVRTWACMAQHSAIKSRTPHAAMGMHP